MLYFTVRDYFSSTMIWNEIMRTLYLHIGMPKTGTTAIQDFCILNQSLLRANNIIYPTLFMRSRKERHYHHHLAISLFHLYKKFESQTRFPRYRYEELMQDLKCKLAECPREADVLISSEYFCIHGECIAGFCRFAEDLAGLFKSIKVILYLRRQDLAFQSWWAQRMKSVIFTSPSITDEIVRTLPVQDQGYDKLCEALATIFGKENLIIRPYERSQFPNGDVVDDFLSILNLKKTDEFQTPPKEINPSLPRDFIEFQKFLNPVLLDQKVSHLILFTEKMYVEGKYQNVFLSPSECLEIIERFDAGNERVAREYMGREDGILFHDKRPAPSDPWIPYPGLSGEACLSVFQALNTHAPYKAVWVTGLIARGLRSNDPEVRAASKKLSPILKCRRCSFLLWLPAQLPLKVLGLFKLPVLKTLLRWMLSRKY